MQHFSVLVCCFLACLLFLGAESGVLLPKSVEDYYWKDFNGLVANTAIAGGKTVDGVTTYIGQLTIPARYNLQNGNVHTVPAVIVPGSQSVVAPYLGQAISSNQTNNAKVLCSSYATTRYKWYSPTSLVPSNCRFVIGGYEDGIALYIGKATEGKEVVVGKIFSETTHHRAGLISPLNGQEVYHDTYTVLTYCY